MRKLFDKYPEFIMLFLLTLVACGLIWWRAPMLQLAAADRPLALAITVIVSLSLVILLMLWPPFRRRKTQRVFNQEVAIKQAEQAGSAGKSDKKPTPAWHPALQRHLAAQHTWWQRQRKLWLLVAGDEDLVRAHFPWLIEQGWLNAPQAVLVWSGATPPAGGWARLRGRWRLPADGVVLVSQHAAPDGGAQLAGLAADCGAALPVQLLLSPAGVSGQRPEAAPPILVGWREEANRAAITLPLFTRLEAPLAASGLAALAGGLALHFDAALSQWLQQQGAALAAGCERLGQWLHRQQSLVGLWFSPAPAWAGAGASAGLLADTPPHASSTASSTPLSALDSALQLRLPAAWLRQFRRSQARRTRPGAGFWLCWAVTLLAVAATVWIALSYQANRAFAHQLRGNLATLQAVRTLEAALAALVAVQQDIAVLEAHRQHGAPWLLRAGMNRDDDLLASAWAPYGAAARHWLAAPVQAQLALQLQALRAVPLDGQPLEGVGVGVGVSVSVPLPAANVIETAAAAARTPDTSSVLAGAARTTPYAPLPTPAAPSPTLAAPVAPVAASTAAISQQGYAALKAWLMLVQPARAEAAFLAPRLAAGGAIAWRGQSPARLQQVAQFYAAHLAQHPAWALPGDAALLQAARQTLAGLIDVEQAADTLYRQLLDETRPRFPDLPLATLTGGRDPRGLWRAAGSLPGLYTRQAYDGFVRDAITRLSQQTANSGDWVLGQQAAKSSESPADIAAALRRRYFTDFAHAWQGYLNRIQWQPAANLAASAEQLRVYADVQQSPLAGLMQTIAWQAQAGAQQRSLADSLLDKAKHAFNNDDADPATQAAAPKPPAAPLAEAFGPLLRLVGSTDAGMAGAGDKPAANPADSLSLQRYLDRASATRLKLDQVSAAADPDAYARQLAQNLFQGRASELVDARDYAQQVAASLGSAWAGMGQNLLLEPLDQGWRTLMRPAAASLNSLWDTSIVRPFSSSFAGRYPFNDSDASLAELARFIGPQGAIARFAGNELAGILQKQGDQWVPNPLYAQALRFDVDFLNRLNQLAWLAGQLYAEGDLKTRFSLMALGHPKVTDSQLQLDGQSVRYFNQRPVWQNLAWPGEPLKAGGTLLWESLDSGLRKQHDYPGPWGFIRLLAKAKTERLNNSDWRLTWGLGDGAQLRYTLRTQAGSGPLALLQLDHFKLPARVFDTGASQPAKPPAAKPGKGK